MTRAHLINVLRASREAIEAVEVCIEKEPDLPEINAQINQALDAVTETVKVARLEP